MRAIEHAQLGGLEGGHVIDQLHPVAFPLRAWPCKVVLDHPLAEAFGKHRTGIAHAKVSFERGQRLRRRARNDAIDHRRGNAAFAPEPLDHVGHVRRQPLLHQPRQHLAVFRQIVTGQEREAAQPARAALGQSLRQQGIEAAASRDEVEPAVRAARIALLGDGEACDMAGRISEPGNYRPGLIGGVEHFANRADHARLRSIALAFGQRIEPVLRIELPGDVGRAERNAANAPVAVPRRHRAIGIPGLVRTVERPDPEMNDADLLRVPVVRVCTDIGRQVGQRIGPEPHRR